MRLNTGTLAVMNYLGRHGWTLKQFAETFKGGCDFNAVDLMDWTDAPGNGNDGSACNKTGPAAFLRDRDALDNDTGDHGVLH